MLKYLTLAVLLLFLYRCTQKTDKKVPEKTAENTQQFKLYSKSVADTFSISVSLPNDYEPKKPYPVVYLLDANLYFDIIATTLHKYSEVGLTAPVILIGIGYKDFQTMDSLRNRDYTYPIAIPEYEMDVSGGADRFLAFIETELIPFMDEKFKPDTSNRILAGHSLGGYFSMYALWRNLPRKGGLFNGYIMASPSIHYNHYWLIDQLESLEPQKKQGKKTKIYLTFGGLEDAENEEDADLESSNKTAERLSKLLSTKQANYLDYKCEIFSNLGHMDTPFPTSVKGLQWILNDEE